ncbi:MAG: radical SAM protein [Candidatus Eremiobacteraeota bacterium]|nr:radical SAM protein [Candidatus Eremiobacteraeota bacterium]
MKNSIVWLCSSIGVSFGYPEPELYSIASFLGRQGFQVLLDHLRIELYLRLKALFEGHPSLGLQAPSRGKLSTRLDFERVNGLMEDYLHGCLYKLITGKDFIADFHARRMDRDLLQAVTALVQDGVLAWKREVLAAGPSIVLIAVSPRKVREVLKHHEFPFVAEINFPAYLFNELHGGISSLFLLYANISVENLALELRQPGRRVNFDMAICNEPYGPLEAVLKAYRAGSDLPTSLPGTLCPSRDNGSLKVNPHCYGSTMEYVVPDYSYLSRSLYRQISGDSLQVIVNGSMGCPLACAFCNVEHLYGPYRQRSAADLVEELLTCSYNFGIRRVSFNDRIMNADPDRLEELCNGLIGAGFRGTWFCYAAVDIPLEMPLLEKMCKAGCSAITFGIESGSSRVLSLMGKSYGRDDASRAVKRTFAAGIPVIASFMTDFPGETEEDFFETLSFIEAHAGEIGNIRLNQFQPYAGSPVFRRHGNYGLTAADLDRPFEPSPRFAKLREFVDSGS